MQDPAQEQLPRGGIPPFVKIALLAFLMLLVGVGLAVWLAGGGEAMMEYEGFN